MIPTPMLDILYIAKPPRGHVKYFGHLRTVDGNAPLHLDTFEADHTDEAIVLSVLRLERREMELMSDHRTLARFSSDGRLTRISDRAA